MLLNLEIQEIHTDTAGHVFILCTRFLQEQSHSYTLLYLDLYKASGNISLNVHPDLGLCIFLGVANIRMNQIHRT